MDIITIVLGIMGMMIFFSFTFSNSNAASFRSLNEAVSTIFVYLVTVVFMVSPFVMYEVDHEITYDIYTESVLVEKTVEGGEKYSQTCTVTLNARIPYTSGVWDETQKLRPYNKACIDLGDDEYATINKAMKQLAIKINELDTD